MYSTATNKVQEVAATFNMLLASPEMTRLRAKVLKNYRYAVGDMLSEAVLKELEAEKRPALMFQLMHRDLLFIAGTIKRDRKKLKAYPTRIGDELLASLHTVMGDNAMDNCDGWDEYAKAALDSAISGIGWTNGFWTFDGFPKGKYILRAEDPLSILWDLDAKKIDQSDWRYLCKQGMYTANEIIGIYSSDLDTGMIDAMRTRAEELEGLYRKDLQGKPIGYYQRQMIFSRFVAENQGSELSPDLLNNMVDARYGTYRVIEWHDYRTTEKRMIYSPIYGTSEPIPDELMKPERQAEYSQFVDAAKQRHGEGKVKSEQVKALWICAAIPGLLPDKMIFERPYVVQEKGFQYKPVFWYDFHYDLTKTTCIIDSLIAPNDLFNHRQMTILQLLRYFANPKVYFQEKSLSPEALSDAKSKEPGVLIPYGGTTPPQDSPPDPNSYRIAETQAKEMVEVMDRIGTYTPNLGGRSETANEPASLYAQRVEQGMVMLAHPFSNIYKCMRNGFNYMDVTLQKFMTTERMVRLFEEPPEGLEGVQKVGEGTWLRVNYQTLEGVKNDVTQGEFDFRVDLASPGQTEKRLNTMLMMEIAKEMANAGQPTEILWYLIVKNSDFPEAKQAAAFLRQQIEQKLSAQQFEQQVAQAQAKLALLGGAQQVTQDARAKKQEQIAA